MKIKHLLIIALLSFTGIVNSAIFTSNSFTGLDNSSIVTTLDDTLKVVKYRIQGNWSSLQFTPQELGFAINTHLLQSDLESDQNRLSFVETQILPSLYTAGGPNKIGVFLAGNEQSLAVKNNTELVLVGIDNSLSKSPEFLFGFVYSDLFEFTGNFVTDTLQINSVDYTFEAPELRLTTVPLPVPLYLFGTALFTLLITGRRNVI